jgi:hypothetical protein
MKGKCRSKRERERERERERDLEIICDLCKQQVFIRERRPDRVPRHQSNTQREPEHTSLTGWGFKHPVEGKGRLEGDGH